MIASFLGLLTITRGQLLGSDYVVEEFGVFQVGAYCVLLLFLWDCVNCASDILDLICLDNSSGNLLLRQQVISWSLPPIKIAPAIKTVLIFLPLTISHCFIAHYVPLKHPCT